MGTFLLLILGVVVLAGVFTFLGLRLTHPKTAKSKEKGAVLSFPAHAVYQEYMALPEESRPFSDIVDILVSLDKKHSLDDLERRRHFNQNWLPLTNKELSYSGYEFSWHPKRQDCSHNRCKFKEYYQLHQNIAMVQRTLDAKKRAVLESENQYATDMIAELEVALRSEAQIQRQVIKELKS